MTGQNQAMTDEPRSNQAEARGRLTDEEYARAMTERNQAARARGLKAPYIPGGEDPDPVATAARERRLKQLLIGMVLVIVVGGFLISIVGLILTSN